MQQIECIINEIQAESFTGRLIQQVAEQTKMEIRLPGPLHTFDWPRVASYSTKSWLIPIFCFAYKHDIQILDKSSNLQPLREQDWFIMDIALDMKLTPRELHKVNNIRQQLQIHRVSELTDLKG